MNIHKLLPVLAALLMLGGCTGSCTAGTQTVPPTFTPPQRLDSAPPSVETPSAPPVETPAVVLTPEPVSSAPAATPTPTAVIPPVSVPVETPAPPVPAPTPTPLPDPTPVPGPDDEAVLAAYRQAVEAFGWFQMTHLPLDMEFPVVVEERTYYRVDYPGLDTLAALRGYLKGIFSDALVEELLPAGSVQYIEVDGVLYGQEGGRGSDITRGGETLQVLWEGESRCLVHVTVEVLDPEQDFAVTGSVEYNFPYEKIGEQWIFTAFSLVR